MNLIICEKPSVGVEFCKVLGVRDRYDGYIEGNGFVVTWALGHLIQLCYPEDYDEKYKKWVLDDLPFLPKEYKYKTIPNAAAKKQFSIIKKLFHREDLDTIYYAGDPAREGIYIQYLIRQEAKPKPGVKEKVIWIDSQTEEEIKRGYREAKDISEYNNLAASGYERAIEDYATGINISRALTLKYGRELIHSAGLKKGAIAVGRVMSCVLGMIVRREREILNFKKTAFYKIVATTENGISLQWKAVEGSPLFNSPMLYDVTGFSKKEDAETFINSLAGEPLTISSVDTKDSKKNAPLLFNLAELQSECSKKFHIPPDKTLEVAQSLYEKKLTTYPRTDARVLSSAIADVIQQNISGFITVPAYKEAATLILSRKWHENIKHYVDDSKISDHYAIIPTGKTKEIDSLNDMEKAVYHLIVRRFLSIFFPPALYKTAELVAECCGEKFFTTKKVLVEPGYLLIAGTDPEKIESDKREAAQLMCFTVGQKINADLSVKEGSTTPPKRYTTGSIILAMENAGNYIEDEELREQIKANGIGTSATRAEILKKLIGNKYIKSEKKTQILTPAPLGDMIYECLLLTVPKFLSPEITANWELGLSQVAEGKITQERFRKTVETMVRKEIEQIINSDLKEQLIKRIEPYKVAYTGPHELEAKCPVCGSSIIKNSKGDYSCSSFSKNKENNCGFYIKGKHFNKTISEKQLAKMLNTGTTDIIKGFTNKDGKKFDAPLKLAQKEFNGKTYWGYEYNFPKVNTGELQESDFTCPKCQNRMQRNNIQLVCSNCNAKIKTSMSTITFTDEQIFTLLQTKNLLGVRCLSKNNKIFLANFKLNDDLSIKMSFAN